MKKLEQNLKRDKRFFEITDKGVSVKINSINEIQQYEVPFEEIGKQTFIFRNLPDTAVILLLFSALFNIIFLLALLEEKLDLSFKAGNIVLIFFVLVFAILIAVFGKSLKANSIKKLDGVKPLLFIYDKKYEEQVDHFIHEILEAKKEFFVKEYFRIDNLIPYEVQKSRIHWLYENKYITESDAKFIIDELDHKRIVEGM